MSRRFRLKSLLVVGCGALAGFAIACSEEDTGSDGSQSEDPFDLPVYNDPKGADESIWDHLGVDDPAPEETRYADYPAPYEDAAGCKAFETRTDPIAAAGGKSFKEIHDCSCDVCFAIQQQCDALEGCREIATCGTEIGCSDAYSCYLIPADAKCVPIIDRWGNTGLAAATSLALSGCTMDNNCRTVTP